MFKERLDPNLRIKKFLNSKRILEVRGEEQEKMLKIVRNLTEKLIQHNNEIHQEEEAFVNKIALFLLSLDTTTEILVKIQTGFDGTLQKSFKGTLNKPYTRLQNSFELFVCLERQIHTISLSSVFSLETVEEQLPLEGGNTTANIENIKTTT